jgi:7,8-dihydropterin-6-yl-methyl-4-(beta-D-ribofuranosyl)aminobenzene 5'-phosphate synthase
MNLKKYGHLVDNIAQELKNHKALLYTCHCTGLRAFKRMESVLPEKIKYLPCGSAIQL